MNSYNDNLHNTIVSSLLNQELEKKQIYSQANAAMFSLYHAEAATITAQSKLTTATEDQTAKQAVNDQSVDATNISNNLVSAADQSNTYLKQAVTNTSVGAANVQIATNAIVKLAGDMGTVFSIVNAADFQSDIYDLTTDAYALINNTAQLAEVASDTAMNTSIKTSEVPGSAVLTKAKNSNTALGNLYSITTSDFNNASAVVATDTVNVATASVAEEKAQGTFENLSVEYRAAFSAYRTMNSELNLGLSTLHMPGMNDTSRNISFSLLRSPFPVLDKTIKAPLGPVQTYYVMLVKDQSKTTFSIVNAEAIVLNENAKQFIKIDGTNYTNYLPSATEPQQKTSTKKSAKTGAAPEPGSTTNPTRFSFSFDFFNMDANTTEPTLMVDSDGDPIALGTDYVLFVMAVYTEAYKKKLNTFDDYLSAGSVKFTLTHKLEGVTATSITLGLNTQAETQAAHPFAFNFPMSGNAGYTVQYRCMLLPYGTEEVPTGMMNELSFLELQADLLRMQQEADSYDAQISGLNEKLAAIGMQSEESNSIQKMISDLEAERANTSAPSTSILRSKERTPGTQIGFIFNIPLAEQVAPGNYINATESADSGNFTAVFGTDMTDIFGNVLQEKWTYIPLVLTVSNDVEQDLSQYKSNWSGYATATIYTYHESGFTPASQPTK